MKKELYVINNWEDVTIELYQELYELMEDSKMDEVDKIIGIVKLLSGLSDDEINRVKYSDIIKVYNKLTFLQTEPSVELTEPFKIGNKLYGFDKELMKMNYGMFVTLKQYLNNDTMKSIPEILSVLIRPIKKFNYDFSKWKGVSKSNYISGYELEDFDATKVNTKIYKNLSINKLYGVVVFFYQFSSVYLKNYIQTYSPQEQNKSQ